MKRWAAELKRGRTSLTNDECSGRPITATTTDNVDKVHKMVLWMTIESRLERLQSVGISKESISHILTGELDMRKLSVHWMPRLLTLDQQRIQMNISKALLERFK